MSMVSIIMTAYNGEKFIGEQIESILASTYQDFELFIYDDGSKDDTMSILRMYEAKFPQKIHVYKNDVNLGVTRNFLQGICRSTSDYVMTCDQDDVWKQNKIAMTLKRLRQMEVQTGKDIPLAVFTDAVVVDSELNTLNASFFKSGHLNPKRTALPQLLMENKLIGCTMMINAALRKVLKRRRLPEGARFHDWWIALIAASFGKIGYLNEGTLLYRQHGGNVVGNTSFLSYFKNRVSTLKKQKASIITSQKQAEEFVELYGDLMQEENRIIIQQFANLGNENIIKRKLIVLHCGYLKTGFLRNIGLLILV